MRSGQIPKVIEEAARKHFSWPNIQKGFQLLLDSHVKPSFSKGSYWNNFTISGLVLENKTSNTRISLRDKKLTSRCNCSNWTEDSHCEHSAAFFLHFLIVEEKLHESHSEGEVDTVFDESAIAPQQFGKYIKDSRKLVGSKGQHYTQLKFKLTDGEVVNFPTPKDWSNQELRITLKTNSGKVLSNDVFGNFLIEFELFDQEIYSKISILESQYLFNWETGEVLEIPQDIKSFIKDLEKNNFYTDPFLILSQSQEIKERVKVYLDEKLIESTPQNCEIQFLIEESTRKNFYEIKMFLKDEDKNLEIPLFLSILINDGGYLKEYSSKIEMNNFLDAYMKREKDYKKFSYTVGRRETFLQYVEPLFKGDQLYFYESHREKLYSLDGEKLFKALQVLYEVLSPSSLRGATLLHPEKDHLIFWSPMRSLEDKLPLLFQRLDGIEVLLFFNKKKVHRWKTTTSISRDYQVKNWFDISFELTKDEIKLIKSLKDKKYTYIDDEKLILLTKEDQTYLQLVQKYLQEAGSEGQLAENGKRRFHLSLNRCRLFDIYQLYHSSGSDLLTSEEVEICQKLLNIESLPGYDFPVEINGSPRSYQTQGYQWLRLLQELQLGACLADDMGLGKTFQTISFLESIKGSMKKVLIVCPVSILMNWKSEFEKFSTIRPTLYYADQRVIPDDSQVIITSYGILRKEIDSTLGKFDWDIVVMDEVQKLKNMKSIGAQAARKLKAQFRVCLTGTPVENDLTEFYNIIDLAVPGVWGNLQNLNYFKRNKDARFIAREVAKPFILRRTKSQVLTDLPDKLEQTVYLTFQSDEKVKYTKTIEEIRNRFDINTNSKKYGQILKDLLTLRQLCLWQAQSSQTLSTKIDFLLDNLEQVLEENHQALVYSQFTKYLDIIEARIKEKGWKFSRIDGSYTINKRQKEVDAFQSGEKKVFLISLKAGGLGLNLTAANFVFIMDPWWNPAVENQAIDRAHRIGQKKNITVYRPIIKGSVEEKVIELQEKKKELFKDLLGNDDQADFSGKLTLDDFRMILS